MLVLIVLLMISSSLGEIYYLGPSYYISTVPLFDEIGHANFQQTGRQTGWDRLYIYTSPLVDPIEQHRAAGFLEGYATYSQIHAAFLNFAGLDFKGQKYAPEDVQLFLDNQLAYMQNMVSQNPKDEFWQYVGYYLEQVRYMHIGYQARIKKEKLSNFDLEFKQLYYLTSIGDLEDLLPWQKGFQGQRKNCNAYIRLIGDQLHITHGTHNRFSFLLRIYKHWHFPRKGVALESTSFTSRPGDLISKDDFFLLSSGLRVLETSLENKVESNLEEVHFTTVPSWLRTLVANHLAKNAEDWMRIFNINRSGTHNNQWIIIDPSRLSSKKGVIYFFQEAFSAYKIIDMTPQLLETGYVAGYNTPYTSQIYQKLGYSQTQDGNYRNQSRAIILKRYHPKMQNIDDMKYWLITNEQQNIKRSLAPRWDLVAEKPVPFGMTDCKITSPETIKSNYFWAISGPPRSNGRFAAFSWKGWDQYPHQGLSSTYNFDWQKILINIEAIPSSLVAQQ